MMQITSRVLVVTFGILSVVLWLVFVMSWRDYHAHGSQFITCPASGCSTTLGLVVGSGVVAAFCTLAFLGALLNSRGKPSDK
jgi:hypothetical protein